jgi:hypothetical protein
VNRLVGYRLGRLLGMDAGLARELFADARRRDGRLVAARVAAFLAATTRLSPRLLPRGVRERAISAFVWWLFEPHQRDPRLPLAYAGRRGALASPPPPLLPE